MKRGRKLGIGAAAALAAALLLFPFGSAAAAPKPKPGLTPAQQSVLRGIARDTWRFYADDVDPATSLPLDNLTFAGGPAVPTGYGRYTSASNIGVHLWAVVAEVQQLAPW